MKIRIFVLLLLAYSSCKNVTEKQEELIHVDVDSTGLIKEKKNDKYSKLISFLEYPIDLKKYKKSKNINYTTTSVCNGMYYYFQPDFKDSIFYTYYFHPEKNADAKRSDEIIVFKYGKNKHSYDDETETLIELRIYNRDLGLGKANLVGVTKMELESRFGTDYLVFENAIAYINKNKVLILKLENSKIASYRYIKLNTQKVSNALLGQLVK